LTCLMASKNLAEVFVGQLSKSSGDLRQLLLETRPYRLKLGILGNSSEDGNE